MKERYSHELPSWMRRLGVRRINCDSIDFKWGYFAPEAGFRFVVNRGTYFDQRWALSFCLGWGEFLVRLPFVTALEAGCDMPRYGFSIHNNSLWIYTGGDYDGSQCQNAWIAVDLPFFSYSFVGHWIQGKDRKWYRMDNSPAMSAVKFRETSAYSETHPYTYTMRSGVVQHRIATCTLEQRKWHRKWFPFLTKEHKVIDIQFSDEVGERSGSWKGGVIGCSYEIKPGENIVDCLRRMEQERKF